MLKSCPSNDELRGFVDEQLSVERARQVTAHLQGCARCGQGVERLQTLLTSIKAPAVAATSADDRFKRGVLSALDNKRPSWTRRWQWALAGAAAAMATAVVAIVVLPTTEVDRGHFQARGAKPTSLSSIAGVDMLVSRRPLREGALLRPGRPLAFRYRNIGEQKLYLLAFAVDSANQVHWFYPAYSDASKDPQATPLAPKTRDKTLADEVEPQGCVNGSLQVVTVISRSSRTVKQVERLLANQEKTRTAIAKLFAKDLVRSWSVRWQQEEHQP